MIHSGIIVLSIVKLFKKKFRSCTVIFIFISNRLYEQNEQYINTYVVFRVLRRENKTCEGTGGAQPPNVLYYLDCSYIKPLERVTI